MSGVPNGYEEVISAPTVFLSYRRTDTGDVAETLSALLREDLGSTNVFRDEEDLIAGQRWQDSIATSIRSSDAVLIMVGDAWTGPRADGTRRIDETDDPVRTEVLEALDKSTEVTPIPILTDIETPPGDLPREVRALFDSRHYISVHREGLGNSSSSEYQHVLVGVWEALRHRVPNGVLIIGDRTAMASVDALVNELNSGKYVDARRLSRFASGACIVSARRLKKFASKWPDVIVLIDDDEPSEELRARLSAVAAHPGLRRLSLIGVGAITGAAITKAAGGGTGSSTTGFGSSTDFVGGLPEAGAGSTGLVSSAWASAGTSTKWAAVAAATIALSGGAALAYVMTDAPGAEPPQSVATTAAAAVTEASTASSQSLETTVESPPTTTTSTSATTVAGTTPDTVVQATIGRAAELLTTLTVADPTRVPFDRDSYDGDGWADFDDDCRSTRDELLIRYSLTEPTLDSSGCSVETGRWVDPYDGATYTLAARVTIDHVVGLAEANRSGAWRWNDDTKRRFTNDETPGHLVVTGQDTNQSKGDKTPDEWLPPDEAYHCQYAIDWIATKARYDLTVTKAEQATLHAILSACSTDTPLRPISDLPQPLVVITTPTTTTTTTIAPSSGTGVVSLIACDRFAEVVTIGNSGGETVSLSGYELHDRFTNHSTGLGIFGSLAPGQQSRIVTGPDAVVADGQVVWKLQNVWNNDGDTAYLVAPDGTETTVDC